MNIVPSHSISEIWFTTTNKTEANNSRRGVRVVEGARLESVYRSKAYRGFESRPLRQRNKKKCPARGIFILKDFLSQARLSLENPLK